MNRRNHLLSAVLAFCAMFAFAIKPAKAQSGLGSLGPTKGRVAGIAIVVAAAGAAACIGIYYAVRHDRNVTGCAGSGPNGMTLTSDSDRHTYTLTGEVAAVKRGDRVRVSGKKIKQKSAGTRQFIVEKVSRDLGACIVDPGNPISSH